MRALHVPRPQRTIAPWPLPRDSHGPKVMDPTPPVTIAATPSLPRRWPVASGSNFHQIASFPIGGMYSFSRSIPRVSPPPSQSYVPADTVTQTVGTRSAAGAQISFYHDGAQLELLFHTTQDGFYVKVDGEYITLDLMGAPGTFNHFLIDFGSRRHRRIDIILYKAGFIEARTGWTDALWAAPIRGPRTICMGDSFTTPGADGWTNWFAEGLGWDDVWASGVGGSGFRADALGNRVPFTARVQSDIIAYRPEVVFIHAGANDLGYDTGEVIDSVTQVVNDIRRHLPEAVVAGGLNISLGLEYLFAENFERAEAIRQAFIAAGGAWMSPFELPQKFAGEPVGIRATLMDPIVAGRAGNSGTPATVDNTTGFRIASDNSDPGTKLRIGATVEIGTGATRERKALTAQTSINGKQVFGFDGVFNHDHAAGEPVREVGPSYATGQGYELAPTGWGNADNYVSADTFHPNRDGNIAIGTVNAVLLKDHLRQIGRG
ncbi:MAG: SGNH/GDSL hydrolase family protein [Sphingomonadaceae bacterium]|nr:SGNH/GDSL hydrolase family protein [Sphingomonadaceae bacterium]